MMHLKQLFKGPLQNVKTSAVVVFLIVALIGFTDATFLTVEHYRNVIPPCTTSGCDKVLTSDYSVIAGIPVPLLGSIYYFALILGALVYLESKISKGTVGPTHLKIIQWTFLTTILGFLFSLYFLYLQAFVIHSYCQYCLGSAATSTILFILGMIYLNTYGIKDTHNGTI